MPIMRARLILLGMSTTFIASCFFHCGPYSCREAEEGRVLYAPVITALEEYRARNGAYPDAIEELIPTFLAEIPASGNEDGPKFPEYQRVDDYFKFTFQYFGPGMNWCVYTPTDEWSCDGHY